MVNLRYRVECIEYCRKLRQSHYKVPYQSLNVSDIVAF